MQQVGRWAAHRTARGLQRVQAAFASSMHGNDPKVLAEEKEKHLKGKTVSPIKGVPGWNEKLASEGEAIVKAEKHHDDGTTVEDLQEHTVTHLKKTHSKP